MQRPANSVYERQVLFMRKKLFVFVPLFLVFTVIFTLITPAVAMSEDISTKVFRLHILANSDSEDDQKLKLKVRDKILSVSDKMYNNCATVDDAVNTAKNNIDLFESTAAKVIIDNGYTYPVKAYVTKEYFDTRKYDNFTLPAGEYDSLKIEIGSAKGHNWWCVMFPSVCISGCVDDLDKSLSNDEIKMITDGKYKYKFKVVEVYEKIKSKIIS